MNNKQQKQRIIKKVTKLLEEDRYDEANEILFEEVRKTSNVDKIQKLLNAQRYDDTKKALALNSFRGGMLWIVQQSLHDPDVPKDLQSAILQKFLDSQDNYSRDSSRWEHDLRAVTPDMWRLLLIDWLERFYKAAFRKSDQSHVSMYKLQLIHQFADYANWSDDPAKFGLSVDNLPEDAPFRDRSFVISSLKKFPFSSEVDYLRWKIDMRQDWGLTWDELYAKVMEFSENDVALSILLGIERKAIKKRAQRLIKEIRKPLDSYVRESVANEIDALIEFLTKIAFDKKHSKFIQHKG